MEKGHKQQTLLSKGTPLSTRYTGGLNQWLHGKCSEQCRARQYSIIPVTIAVVIIITNVHIGKVRLWVIKYTTIWKKEKEKKKTPLSPAGAVTLTTKGHCVVNKAP